MDEGNGRCGLLHWAQMGLNIFQRFRLDIDRIDRSAGSHGLYKATGEISRSRSEIGHGHAWFKAEGLDYFRRFLIDVTIGPVKPVQVFGDVRHSVLMSLVMRLMMRPSLVLS